MIAFPLFPTLELSITRISWAQEKYKEKLINNFSKIKAGGFFCPRSRQNSLNSDESLKFSHPC